MDGIVIAFVGNKVPYCCSVIALTVVLTRFSASLQLDLAERRRVETEEGQNFAEDNDLVFIETSAKTGTNVTEVFHEIGAWVPARQATDSGDCCSRNIAPESFVTRAKAARLDLCAKRATSEKELLQLTPHRSRR